MSANVASATMKTKSLRMELSSYACVIAVDCAGRSAHAALLRLPDHLLNSRKATAKSAATNRTSNKVRPASAHCRDYSPSAGRLSINCSAHQPAARRCGGDGPPFRKRKRGGVGRKRP